MMNLQGLLASNESGVFILKGEYDRAAAVYLGALPPMGEQINAAIASLALSARPAIVAMRRLNGVERFSAKRRHIHAKAQRRERRVRQYFTLSLEGIL